MARFVHYHCSSCDRIFRYLHHPSDAPGPETCTLCGAFVAKDPPPEPVFAPAAPLIRENAYARSIDRVYRAQEQSSLDRADAGEALLERMYRDQPVEDGPEREMIEHARKLELAGLKSGIKMTNMQDPSSMREGDMAAIGAVAGTPPGLREGGQVAQFQALGGQVPNYAPGIAPHTGDQARQAIVAQHGAQAQAMTARGQMSPTFFDRS